MIKILFVCHGNICRSPMAEFVMRDLVRKAGRDDEIAVASAATSTEELGCNTHRGTRRILDEYGIPYEKRCARQIVSKDYEEYDYLIGMDGYNLMNMQRFFKGDPENKCSLLLSWAGSTRDVADPWYTGDFETTYRDVVEGCEALLEQL